MIEELNKGKIGLSEKEWKNTNSLVHFLKNRVYESVMLFGYWIVLNKVLKSQIF